MVEKLKRYAPLALILIAGAALRLYQIGALPPGLYRDEAFYALDALRALDGGPAAWFPANNGREGLFISLMALSVGAFGNTVFAVRLTAALVGSATLLAIYAAGRQMFSHRIGVLSAGVLAVTFWHLAISRVAYRAISLPLLLCVTLALLFTALRASALRPRLSWSAAAGAAAGLTLYTYTSGQFLLPLLAVYLLSLFIGLRRMLFARRNETSWLRHRASIAAFGAGMAIMLIPLALTVLSTPGLLTNRAGQVSLLNPAINNGDLFGALLRNALKVLGMFLFEGDRIWRHNLSLRPVFDGFLGLAFVIGVGACLWRWWRSWQSRFGSDVLGIEHNVAPQFLVLWLLVFLTPTLLAEDAPHFLRAIGALPAACMLAAVGLETALAWASRRGILSMLFFPPLRRLISPPALTATLILCLSGYNTANAYFNDYVKRDLTGYWLEAHNVALAGAVNDARARGVANIYIEGRLANDNATLAFLSGERYTVVRDGMLPAQSGTVLLLVDPNHDWSAYRAALPPNVTLRTAVGPKAQNDKDAQPRDAFLAIEARTTLAAEPPIAMFEHGPALLTATISAVPGGASNLRAVTLTWRGDTALAENYAVFVHWVRNGQPAPIAQHDGDPAGGFLPMQLWRIGDSIEDVHILAIPDGPQPGDEVRVGLYRRADNRRLIVLDPAGKRQADYVIIR